MTPVAILETIHAGFLFGTELLKFAQTDQGRDLIEQSLADRAKWDSFWLDVGNGLTAFFTGTLFVPKL